MQFEDESRRWFAVRTHPRREASAEAQLRRQSFPTFLPLYSRTARRAQRARQTRSPLFPSYLFVALDLTRDRWRAVNSTFGVSTLVMAGDRPSAVPKGVVEQLVAVSDEEGVVDLAVRRRPGDRVQVVSGPFAALLGRIETTDDAGRVRILLELMGRPVSVWMPAEALQPVSS